MLTFSNNKPIFIFFLLLSVMACKNNRDSADLNRRVVEDLHANLSAIYPNNLYVQYRMEGKRIPDSVFISDLSGKTMSLKSVVKRPKLIMRFSDINCNTCVEQELENLRKFFPAPHNSMNIMILATYRNIADLLKFKRINAIDYELFAIDKNQLELSGEANSTPYMFILDSSLRVSFPFVPTKEFPDCSIGYYKAILEAEIL